MLPVLKRLQCSKLAGAAVGSLLLVSGAISAQQVDPTETLRVQNPSSLTADYRIGARDLLEIRVFDLEQLDTSVRVSENGTISLPLIGEIVAAGVTRAGLEEAIKIALKRYITDPQVSVFIREYQSQRFSVMGAVQNPGTYEMVGRKNLLEAISDAGGINDAESAGTVTILRARIEGAPLQIELDQLLELGTTALNIQIEPGDTINVVPKKRFFIYVYGQVRTPGSFELREDVTLLQAISLAGGLGDRAASSKIRILRRMPDGSQDVIEVNLDEIVDGNSPDIPVRPNDVIIVPETFF